MNVALSSHDILIIALGSACFGIVCKIPPRFFVHATLLAMTAKIGTTIIGVFAHIGFATFVSAFIVALFSHLFARRTGKPAQAFLIPGVMYLVPGSSLYRSFASALANDYLGSMTLLMQAIIITVAISFALLLANWIVPSKRAL